MSGQILRDSRTWIVLLMVLAAAAMRIIPHPANFSPIAAMALFSGAVLGRRSIGIAVAIPMVAMFLSDLVIGFHNQMIAVYGSMALISVLGTWVYGKRSAFRIATGTLGGAILFFVVTNFSVWAVGGGYEKSVSGLVTCYTMAIPFFQNTLVGDAIFACVLFGIYAWVERAVPSTRFVEERLKSHG
jgi:hypothetical protein